MIASYYQILRKLFFEHYLISIKYANGICSILHKLNFCTKLVQNYKRWIMQQPQCQTYCNLFLGDIKQLLFQNAIR